MRYCPPIYVLCVSSHLWTVPRQIKFWAILIKSWDWRDPPPPVGTKSQVYPKKLLDGSPKLLFRNRRRAAIMYYSQVYPLFRIPRCRPSLSTSRAASRRRASHRRAGPSSPRPACSPRGPPPPVPPRTPSPDTELPTVGVAEKMLLRRCRCLSFDN